jgi:type II secretion system protein J
MIVRPSSRAGFTLIEIIISVSVGAMILTGAYVCLHAGLVSRKELEPRLDALQNARVAMALITADLRNACLLPETSGFVGLHRTIDEDINADNLDFATHNYTPNRQHQGDFCEVSLFLEKDKETGDYILWRRRNPTIALDPLKGGTREELARGLRGLTFEYYDGIEWSDKWGELNPEKKRGSRKKKVDLEGLPLAVRVTMQFATVAIKKRSDDAPADSVPSLTFQSIVRLNLADSLAGDGLGGAPSGGGSQQEGGAE